MLNPYYERELASLKDLAQEFSKAHPALAPMLAGPTSDPDVERLLEGVAFLTGQVRQKLDDEFPEIVQSLMGMFFPQCLRPVPSTTIISFAPKNSLNEPAMVKAGTRLASAPVDGVQCLFQTCRDVKVDQLSLAGADMDLRPGVPSSLKLTFELAGVDLTQWSRGDIRLYINENLGDATKIFYLLMRYVDRVSIGTDGGQYHSLAPECVRATGFEEDGGLFPYPARSFPGYRLLQEYMVLPQKFLFVDLTGLSAFTEPPAGNRFEVIFHLNDAPKWVPKIDKETFRLNCTPAVNLFGHDAQPVSLDHKKIEYRIRASEYMRDKLQVYTVNKVSGYRQGEADEIVYAPFDFFGSVTENLGTYKITLKPSKISHTIEYFLSITYPPSLEVAATETLSIDLTCSNGHKPESLGVGDISKPTDTSPERLDFTNIIPATPYIPPPVGGETLWRLLSHMSLNYLSVATADTLKTLLNLYLFSDDGAKAKDLSTYISNRKRIDGINEVAVTPSQRIVGGIMLRGSVIRVNVNEDYFAGPGDLYLFGCVLDLFFGSYASINSFTMFEVKGERTGEVTQWRARLGERPLT